MATRTPRRKPDIGPSLQDALPGSPGPEAGEEPGETPTVQEKPNGGRGAVLPGATRQLPTEPRLPSGKLEDKMVMIYGPPGIGKSTLASEFGKVFFFECEPGLDELAVIREPVSSWIDFCEWVVALKADAGKTYDAFCIDTADMLALYCSEHTNNKLGIVHESDAEWGKGWSVAKKELQRWVAKLAAVPDTGLLIISHSQEIEIKKRNQVYTKSIPTLSKGARDTFVNMSDLVLFIDLEDTEEGDERRIIRTVPSQYWEAKQRGKRHRLPESLVFEPGEGFSTLKKAWEEGGQE
jgi:hypothetical protein